MSMAKSSTFYNLEEVYDVAMMNLNNIESDCAQYESSEKNKAADERTGDAKKVCLNDESKVL